jgi:hypothetical protein
MSNKDKFRYAVLSAVHDQGLSVGDAVDQAYEAQLAEIEQLNARIAELEKFVSACRYPGPDVIEQLRQEAQQLLAKRKE